MGKKYVAFYLPSSIGVPIMFDFELDFIPTNSRDGFLETTRAFRGHVATFGRQNPFPDEIIAEFDNIDVDRLLNDCEFIPEHTFFVATETSERFFSMLDGCECRMCGNNGEMTVFKSVNGGIVDIVKTSDAMKVFQRV